MSYVSLSPHPSHHLAQKPSSSSSTIIIIINKICTALMPCLIVTSICIQIPQFVQITGQLDRQQNILPDPPTHSHAWEQQQVIFMTIHWWPSRWWMRVGLLWSSLFTLKYDSPKPCVVAHQFIYSGFCCLCLEGSEGPALYSSSSPATAR